MTEKQDGGFPPRRLRHSRPQGKTSLSLRKVVQSGLVLFGALFFGVIGLELYQAKFASRPVVSVSPPSKAEEDASITELASVEPVALHGQETATKAVTFPVKEAQQGAASTSAETVSQKAEPQKSGQIQTAVVTAAKGSETGKSISNGNTETKPQSAKNIHATASVKPKAINHVVKKGETLYMLSRKYYGNNSGVERIARYNGFSAETQLIAGKVVMIPISK